MRIPTDIQSETAGTVDLVNAIWAMMRVRVLILAVLLRCVWTLRATQFCVHC